ncbi:MAG: bioA [Gammaproteobacteria bacterium]|jgi:adenosylmethionine-8-amino-7-oxononanoate aminotransferase|nr:bioA [Gammaproteobacteria bacterium]
MTLAFRDQAAIWHPLTQHQITPPPLPIMRGEGAYLIDQLGNRYLDLVSSWWVTIHGHAQPDIAKAIYEQALKIEQVIFAGFTHEPAVRLAEELLTLLPAHFNKIYYSDNGSTAVEVALKMAYQYWRNQGKRRRSRFIAFKQGYHGDTFGAMAVSKESFYFKQFSDLLFAVDLFDYPATWLGDTQVEEKEYIIIKKLKSHLNKHSEETAALIIEPLIQAAGGMNMCRPEFLQQLIAVVKSYDVLIIYDEIMTGFYRTGEMFACDKSHTAPDIICLSKGLTGGFLPLSVTVCTEAIYQAFLGSDYTKALGHSHSYTANPLGCAAALASLKLLQRSETRSQLKLIERIHLEELFSTRENLNVEKIRYHGTVAAFDLVLSAEYGSQASVNLRERFLKHGLIIRPLGNIVYLLPPYCISESDLRRAYHLIRKEMKGITT